MFHESIIKVELTPLNKLVMLKFYVSSNKNDFTKPILVMGKTDFACLRSIYKYFDKHKYNGVPVQVI